MAIRTILRLKSVKAATGFESDSQIYDLMAQGKFPRPVKLSKQAVGWFEDEIEAWQAERERAVIGRPRERKSRHADEAA